MKVQNDNLTYTYIEPDSIDNLFISNHFTWLKEGLYNTSQRMKCTSWEFDHDDNLGNTWTSEWNLVCDKEYLYVLTTC